MKAREDTSRKMKKITLSLDEQTLDILQKYSDDNFLNSKSQAIRVLVNKHYADKKIQ